MEEQQQVEAVVREHLLRLVASIAAGEAELDAGGPMVTLDDLAAEGDHDG